MRHDLGDVRFTDDRHVVGGRSGNRDVARRQVLCPHPFVVMVVCTEHHEYAPVIRNRPVEPTDSPTDLLHRTC